MEYDFYTPVFKTGRIMVYHCPSLRPFHMSHSNLRTPWPIHFKFHTVIGMDGLTVCIPYGEISNFHSRVMGLYSSNCRRLFKLRIVIGIDSLMVCILFGEISIFHSRVMGLCSSNCRRFFVSHCKLRTPSPIHFKLRTVIGIDSLY